MNIYIHLIVVFFFSISYDISFLFSFKDQIEGARLLSLLAQINSWPAAIFTELKYVTKKTKNFINKFFILFLSADRRTLTFHVLDNAYQINASNVANTACKFYSFRS